jgi:hypothetical protein
MQCKQQNEALANRARRAEYACSLVSPELFEGLDRTYRTSSWGSFDYAM